MSAEATLPALCEATGNTLIAVGRTPKGQRSHWLAIWRTARGNIMHQVTPFQVGDTDEADAILFALGNPDTW